MHDHLSFRWIPAATESDSADDVVQLFARGLSERGADDVRVTAHDRSWGVSVRLRKFRFVVLIGQTDEERGEWLVVVFSRLSRVRRLLGADDTPHLIGLLRWIEEIAFGSEQCVDQVWQTKEAWHESRVHGSS